MNKKQKTIVQEKKSENKVRKSENLHTTTDRFHVLPLRNVRNFPSLYIGGESF